MRKIILFLCIGVMMLASYGCRKGNKVTSIEVMGDTEFDESFRLSDISIKVNKADGSSEMLPLDASMISEADLAKFNQVGKHDITVTYSNASATFEITIRGEKGEDGREVELIVAEGFIRWRYFGEDTWRDLVSLSLLTGPQGDNGADGREIEFQVTDTYIQWRHIGDSLWKDLVALSLITGNTGASGTDGREIEFNVAEGSIQWRHVGDAEWINIISLSSLKGPQGEMGPTPLIEISADGFWVINGEKTTSRAVPDTMTCTLTFEPNGGMMPDGSPNVIGNIVKGDSIVLPIPSKDGYAFKGWFTGETVNDGQFFNASPVTGNFKLYARWETNAFDTARLDLFLSKFNNGNYSAQYDITEMTVEEQERVFLSSTMLEKVFQDQGMTYLYRQKVSTDTASEQYLFSKTDGLVTLVKPSSVSPWRYDKLGLQAKPVLDEMLQAYLEFGHFERRENEDIYDYYVEPGRKPDLIARLLDGPNLEEVMKYISILDVILTINLPLQELSIIIMYGGEPLTDYEITVTDLGTTSFTYPTLEEMKSICVNQIDDLESEVNLDFVLPASLEGYESLVNSHKTEISNAIDIFLCADKMDEALVAIGGYVFEYDTLARAKAENSENLSEYYQVLWNSATADSITAMTALLNQGLALINASVTEEEVLNQYNSYYTQITGAYVIDFVKVDLKNVRNVYLEYLSGYVSSFHGVPELTSVLSSYTNEINAAADYEAITTSFSEGLNALLGVDFVADAEDLELYRGHVLGDLDLNFDGLQNLYNGGPTGIDDQYYDAVDNIFETVDPDIIAATFVQMMNLVNDTYLTEIKEILKLNMLGQYNQYIDILYDPTAFQALYDETVTLIDNAHSFIVYQISDRFFLYVETEVPDDIDPLKQFKKDAIADLTGYYDNLARTALASSQEDMLEYLNSGIDVINTSSSISEVNYALASHIDLIQGVYVVDLVKTDLIDYKEETVSLIGVYLNYCPYNDTLWDTHNQYVQLIRAAINQTEVTSYYEQWQESALSLNVYAGSLELNDYKVLVARELTDLYNMYRPIYIDHGTDYGSEYYTYYYAINDAMTINEAAVAYYDGRDFLFNQALSLKRTDALNELSHLMENAQKTITADFSVITAQYDYYLNLINVSHDADMLETYAHMFLDYLMTFVTDDLGKAKFDAVLNITIYYESALGGGDANDAIAMKAMLDDCTADIMASTTITGVQTLENQFYNDIYMLLNS